MPDLKQFALTFAALRKQNAARVVRWHGEDSNWTGADWSNAMCGEAGEAANVVKKLRRIECATPGNGDPSRDELLSMLADEIADTITYADLLAKHYGIDTGEAVARKFNKVSVKQGFPERLPEMSTGATVVPVPHDYWPGAREDFAEKIEHGRLKPYPAGGKADGCRCGRPADFCPELLAIEAAS